MSAPTLPPVQMPVERAAARAPDGGSATSGAARRATDRARASATTILTSGSGVSQQAATGGKTLLGQ
ncbi:MAG: hypothetical protein ACRCSX_02065 [Allorhizobium sp.]